jgi:peptidyl-prolyl cis-trans isomerase B (cyclophilin B)
VIERSEAVRRTAGAALAAVALATGWGCGSSTPGAAPHPPATRPPAPRAPVSPPGVPGIDTWELEPVELPELREKALLLLLVDRQIYERFVVNQALEGSVELKRALATALGRAGDPQGRAVLERLLDDPDREVRHAAIFALGELEEPLGVGPLERLVGGADEQAARLAVEALAKLGVGLGEVTAQLHALDDTAVARRLLPSLYRFDKAESLLPAARWLGLADPSLHAWAAYALARDAVAEAAVYLRPLLADPDPWVRGWAARALGAIGAAPDLVALEALLADPEEGPVIQSLRAADRLVREGRAAAAEGWKDDLERLAGDARPGVRLTALEAMGSWLPDERLAALLEERFGRGTPRERQIALLALARGGAVAAVDLTRLAAADADARVRRLAARAAVELELVDLVLSMMSDPSAAVRAEAVDALLASGLRSGGEVAMLALVDPAAPVRVVGLQWLVDHPELAAERVVQALRPVEDEDRVELEVSVIRALAARASVASTETELVLDSLERLGRRDDFLVRRAVGAALLGLGVQPIEVGPATEGRDLEAYSNIVRRTSRERFVRLETDKGRVTLRLACPTAPLTCLSFIQLVEVGFFDGLAFHRVVPDFVVQGGDPSGGGWGGPGYTLRDEINPLRFESGVLGMAHSGPDTAGSQFFVTLSRQPHLDGAYTVFGRVTSGMDVLHRMEQEDRILTVREVAAP